jgi:hypothetical protein
MGGVLSVSLQHRYQATWSSMLYEYRPRLKEVLSFASRELMKGAGWHGIAWRIPCSMFQIRMEGRLHYHSASIRDPPHANATRGLLRYQSNLNTYLLLRCYHKNFLLLKSFFAKLVTLREETRGWRWPPRTVSKWDRQCCRHICVLKRRFLTIMRVQRPSTNSMTAGH